MQTNLMIESKFNDAMAYAHNAIKNFPRYEKYTLGVEISKTMWEIKRHMIAARFLHHKKTALRNLDYLGYRIYSHTKRLRKSSVKRIKTKIRQHAKGKITDADMRKMTASWHGHAKHADSDGLIKSLNTLTESLKNDQ